MYVNELAGFQNHQQKCPCFVHASPVFSRLEKTSPCELRLATSSRGFSVQNVYVSAYVDVSLHVTYVNVYVYMSEFMCAYVKIEKYKYIKYIISTYVCAFYTNQIHLYKFSIYLYFPKLYLYNA